MHVRADEDGTGADHDADPLRAAHRTTTVPFMLLWILQMYG